MTAKQLFNLTYLNAEIEMQKQRLKQLRESATDISAKISGMPHVSGISDKPAIAGEIADLEKIIKKREMDAIAERELLMQYISKIDNSLIRQIIELRYVDGKSWTYIAMAVGGNNTADSVRMAHIRYLDQNK